MSLSPYLDPRSLNNGATVTAALSKDIGLSDLYGDLDKRKEAGVLLKNSANSEYGMTYAINTAKSMMDSLGDLLGSRTPYYIIGEIPKSAMSDEAKTFANTSDSWVGGQLVRAITQNAFSKTKQEGVIIDCLGDIESTISVQFTSNPLFYQTSSVIDSRIREPIKLKATVGVSNYLSDDLRGAVGNALSGLDPTGTVGILRDAALYDGQTRAQYALMRLRKLMETGMPFTVYTPHGYYDNMLIQSITPRTNESTMDMLLCDITFSEIIMYMPYYNQSTSKGVKQAAGTEVSEDNSGEKAKKDVDTINKTKK